MNVNSSNGTAYYKEQWTDTLLNELVKIKPEIHSYKKSIFLLFLDANFGRIGEFHISYISKLFETHLSELENNTDINSYLDVYLDHISDPSERESLKQKFISQIRRYKKALLLDETTAQRINELLACNV